MAIYCKTGDKPTVYYRFGKEVADQKISFGSAPIDVMVIDSSNRKTTTITINAKTWSFFVGDNALRTRLRVEHALATYVDWIMDWDYGAGRLNPGGRALDFPGYKKNIYFYRNPYPSTLPSSLIYVIEEFGGGDATKCKLQISSGGRLLFEKEGDKPCIFDVGCEGCPKGFCKQSLPNGKFCCLPSDRVIADIRAMKSILRRR